MGQVGDPKPGTGPTRPVGTSPVGKPAAERQRGGRRGSTSKPDHPASRTPHPDRTTPQAASATHPEGNAAVYSEADSQIFAKYIRRCRRDSTDRARPSSGSAQWPSSASKNALACRGASNTRVRETSTCRYRSSGRKQHFEGEHYLVLRREGSKLIGQSLPHSVDSRLRLHLSVDGPVATGTWTERTSPEGYYRGAVYHGTLQLVIDPMGGPMTSREAGCRPRCTGSPRPTRPPSARTRPAPCPAPGSLP